MTRYGRIRDGRISQVVDDDKEPQIGGVWVELTDDRMSVGDSWPWSPAATPARFSLTQEEFWDRWTKAERISLDLAMQHDPGATNALQRAAAEWRYRYGELLALPVVDTRRNKVERFVADAETAGILASGRGAALLAAA